MAQSFSDTYLPPLGRGRQKSMEFWGLWHITAYRTTGIGPLICQLVPWNNRKPGPSGYTQLLPGAHVPGFKPEKLALESGRKKVTPFCATGDWCSGGFFYERDRFIR